MYILDLNNATVKLYDVLTYMQNKIYNETVNVVDDLEEMINTHDIVDDSKEMFHNSKDYISTLRYNNYYVYDPYDVSPCIHRHYNKIINHLPTYDSISDNYLIYLFLFSVLMGFCICTLSKKKNTRSEIVEDIDNQMDNEKTNIKEDKQPVITV